MRERTSKADNGALRRRIIQQIGAAAVGSHRGGVDDCASLFEMWQGSLNHIKHREDIGTEYLLQLFGGNICDAFLRELDRGVIDQYIQAAQFLDRVLHGTSTELF